MRVIRFDLITHETTNGQTHTVLASKVQESN